MVPQILAVIYGEEYDLPKMSGAVVIFKTLIDLKKNETKKLKYSIIENQPDELYLDDNEFLF